MVSQLFALIVSPFLVVEPNYALALSPFVSDGSADAITRTVNGLEAEKSVLAQRAAQVPFCVTHAVCCHHGVRP